MPNDDYDNESWADDEALMEVLESEGVWGSDDNGFAEARRGPGRYQSKYSGWKGTRIPQPRPARPVGGLAGGAINTPAGKANFRFEKPVATKESVDNLAKELKKELQLNAEAIRKVDQTLDRNTSMLDKKIIALEATHKKAQSQGQMSMLLPLLLSKPPAVEKIKLGAVPTAGFVKDAEVPIAETTYKKDDSSFLLIAMMMMSGGMGGGSDGFSSMMPLMFLSGAFK
jgi:hypothetical protein